MIAIVVAIAQTLASLGFGLAVLRLARYETEPGVLRLGMALGLGAGCLGWLGFWIGVGGAFGAATFAGVVAAGLLLVWLRRGDLTLARGGDRPDRITVVLLAALCASLFIDLLEAFAPAGDVDTMAYHFALPKQFLQQHRIFFVPLAVEGAVPLLMHMTYALALALGGEQAVQLWLLITQIGLLATLYGVARRWLDRDWSLALVLVLNVTPATIYGGGTGHVETRTALFMLIAVIAATDAVERRAVGAAIVAGLAAGFFAGAKYYGLFAACAVGLIFLAGRPQWRAVAAYAGMAAVAGSQWYVWTWIHSGMPVFPTLYAMFGVRDQMWNEQAAQFFQRAYARWSPLPTTVATFVSYPVVATVAPPSALEAGRTGLGPFLFLALPWLIGALRRWKDLVGPTLLRVLLAATVFYGLWFWIPTSQLTRQLLPIYPLALLVVGVAGTRWSRLNGSTKPWAAVFALSITLGMAVHAAYGVNFLRHHLKRESRSEFLERNVAFASVAAWANANIGPADRLGNPLRAMNYLIDVPYAMLHPMYQARVELRPDARSVPTFVRQLDRERLTHLLVHPSLTANVGPDNALVNLSRGLVANGCAVLQQRVPTIVISSRTMGTFVRDTVDALRLTTSSPECRRQLNLARTP